MISSEEIIENLLNLALSDIRDIDYPVYPGKRHKSKTKRLRSYRSSFQHGRYIWGVAVHIQDQVFLCCRVRTPNLGITCCDVT